MQRYDHLAVKRVVAAVNDGTNQNRFFLNSVRSSAAQVPTSVSLLQCKYLHGNMDLAYLIRVLLIICNNTR